MLMMQWLYLFYTEFSFWNKMFKTVIGYSFILIIYQTDTGYINILKHNASSVFFVYHNYDFLISSIYFRIIV